MNNENTNQQPNNQNTGNKINFNTLINIITLAGLIVLYGLYFSDCSKKADTKPDTEKAIKAISDTSLLNIGFVDTDKLLEEYDFAKKMRDEMLAEQQRLETDIIQKQKQFQREVEEFQRQIQQGIITTEQAQAKEQELMQKQQQLATLNEDYTRKLRQKEIDFNTELFDSISSFIGRYDDEFDFDFVLDHSVGGGVLYAGEKYDITEDFIKKINEKLE